MSLAPGVVVFEGGWIDARRLLTMALVYGLALGLVVIVYLFVLGASTPWPGGPQLTPEGVRNLSISLLVVMLLLCGLLLGGLAESIGSIAARATPGAAPATTASVAVTTAPVDSMPVTIDSTLTAELPLPDATAGDLPTAVSQADATPTPTPTVRTPTGTRVTTGTSASPDQVVTNTPGATLTLEPLGATSTPTATPAALPLDPRELVDTVLRGAIERANDAQAEAMLGGDEGAVDPWWNGQARERALENVRRVRSRFITVTEVQWSPVGEGIQLLASNPISATYTTSETWSFTGTIDQVCADGSAMRRRYVETYPAEQYALELRGGIYIVTLWQLGQTVTNEVRTFCP